MKRVLLPLALAAAITVPVGAQYGWFQLNGGLIARLSSSETAATIRQDGSGAVLDLYAGTTRIFRADQNALFTFTGTTLSTVAHILGTADTSGCRAEINSGVWTFREGDDSADCPIQALTVGVGAGTVGAPSLYGQSGSTATGFYYPATNELAATVNGSQLQRWTGGGTLIHTLPLFLSTVSAGTNSVGLMSTGVAGGLRVSTDTAGTNRYDITLADWGTTLSAEAVSVANAAVLDGPASGVGRLFISIGTDNRSCEFELTGTGAPVELLDGGGFCSITKDTATSLNVYFETDKYKIQNNRGGTRALRIVLVGG